MARPRAILGRLGALMGRLRTLLDSSGAGSESSGASLGRPGSLWSSFGPSGTSSWGLLGPSGGHLGPSWVPSESLRGDFVTGSLVAGSWKLVRALRGTPKGTKKKGHRKASGDLFSGLPCRGLAAGSLTRRPWKRPLAAVLRPFGPPTGTKEKGHRRASGDLFSVCQSRPPTTAGKAGGNLKNTRVSGVILSLGALLRAPGSLFGPFGERREAPRKKVTAGPPVTFLSVCLFGVLRRALSQASPGGGPWVPSRAPSGNTERHTEKRSPQSLR